MDNLEQVLAIRAEFPQTLTYNDFYWTNLAVSHDKAKALMFDYNLLGRGLRYNDIRNVCSSMSEGAGEVFVKAYGGIDKDEKTIDAGISILVNLYFACQRPTMPNWAHDSLKAIEDGRLEAAFRRILYI